MTPGESNNEWYHYYCSKLYVFKSKIHYDLEQSSFQMKYESKKEGTLYAPVYERLVLSHMRATKAQTILRIRAVSPEPKAGALTP